MNKCCFGVITFLHCFASSGSGWGPNSSCHLHNYDTNTFSSLIILGSSIGLSINLSIGELGLTMLALMLDLKYNECIASNNTIGL
jgi:hypothetical protein